MIYLHQNGFTVINILEYNQTPSILLTLRTSSGNCIIDLACPHCVCACPMNVHTIFCFLAQGNAQGQSFQFLPQPQISRGSFDVSEWLLWKSASQFD